MVSAEGVYHLTLFCRMSLGQNQTRSVLKSAPPPKGWHFGASMGNFFVLFCTTPNLLLPHASVYQPHFPIVTADGWWLFPHTPLVGMEKIYRFAHEEPLGLCLPKQGAFDVFRPLPPPPQNPTLTAVFSTPELGKNPNGTNFAPNRRWAFGGPVSGPFLGYVFPPFWRADGRSAKICE